MPIVIPKQFYVTKQYRSDIQAGYNLLGFASPYTKDAAFEKRRATQDNWAYKGYGPQFDINDDGSIVPAANSTVDRLDLFAKNAYPSLMDNVLTDGFEVSKSVKRSGWNGSGNVVWRISDPRGYDLEISSENFARIIDCAVVEMGTIKGKCIWGREGAKNILLPEASDIYQQAEKDTERATLRVPLNDVQLGDIVEIAGKLTEECQYLGKYHILSFRAPNTSSVPVTSARPILEEWWVVRPVTGPRYHAIKTCKVVRVLKKCDTPLDKKTVEQEINDSITSANYLIGQSDAIMVSSTKFSTKDISIALVAANEPASRTDWPDQGDYSITTSALFNIKGTPGYWLPGHNYQSLIKAEFDEQSQSLSIPMAIDVHHYRSRYDQYYENIRLVANVSQLTKYYLMVTANNITKPMYRMAFYNY